MKIIDCNLDYLMFSDYRSTLDYLDSSLVDCYSEFGEGRIFLVCNKTTSAWLRKLKLIGEFRDRFDLKYDGFLENCIGLWKSHEVLIKDSISDGMIVFCDNPKIEGSGKVIGLKINKK